MIVIQSKTLAKAETSDIGFPFGPAKGQTFCKGTHETQQVVEKKSQRVARKKLQERRDVGMDES